MTSVSENISNIGFVILHSKLKDSVIARLLSQRQIKFRTSERLLEGTVIFSKTKLNFLVVDTAVTTDRAQTCTQTNDGCDVSHGCENGSVHVNMKNRIDKFIATHGQCIVILKAPLFTSAEFRILSHLQTIYLEKSVDFIPAHSADDCVNAMLTLAQVQTAPACQVLHERMCDLMNGLLEPPSCLSFVHHQ